MPDKKITKNLTTEIRREIVQRFMVPNNFYGYFHALMPLLGLVITFAYASHAPFWQATWLVPLIGWIFYRIYFPLHDCCHYSLVKGKQSNIALGYLMGGFLVTPFDSFRREHVFHHIHFSTEKDPGGLDYYLSFKSGREMIFFLLSPLIGGTLLHKAKEYFHKVGNPDATNTQGERKADYIGYIVVAAVQLGVLTLLTNGMTLSEWWRYPLFVILPGATVFLFLSRLRMFIEHGSLNYDVFSYPEHSRKTARTFSSNCFEVALFSGAGFQYHYEHHLLPGIPSVHLKTVHKRYIAPTIEPEDLRSSYVSSIKELWTYLRRSH